MRYIPLLIILIACKTDKTDEFWLKSENQNGDLTFFNVSDEYCKKALKVVTEYSTLSYISDSLDAKNIASVLNDSNTYSDKERVVLAELDNIHREADYVIQYLYEDMVAASRGYCSYGFPFLPYRKVDVKTFWSDYKNATSFLNVFSRFNGDIYKIVRNYQDGESAKLVYNHSETDAIKLKQLNTIEAMIYLRLIQLSIVDIKLRAKSLVLENDLIDADATEI